MIVHQDGKGNHRKAVVILIAIIGRFLAFLAFSLCSYSLFDRVISSNRKSHFVGSLSRLDQSPPSPPSLLISAISAISHL
jgi:RsiW-degrading membrane proteinase PrsW (M82 family)